MESPCLHLNDTNSFTTFCHLLGISCKQVQQLNNSVWHVNSAGSSSTLLEHGHVTPVVRGAGGLDLLNSSASYLYTNEVSDNGKPDSLVEGWDIVEHPKFPPPSQTEDIKHWTRAMFVDAKRK